MIQLGICTIRRILLEYDELVLYSMFLEYYDIVLLPYYTRVRDILDYYELCA